MKTKIVKIGNSRGIRIPKSILDESGVKDEVELEVKDDKIILKRAANKRENWDKAFQKMVKNNDDILLDKDYITKQTIWDDEEWEW